MAPRNKENDGNRRKKGDRNRRLSEDTGSGYSSGGEVEEIGEGGEVNYRKRRDRNNQAVKRSRVKSKLRTQQTLDRVNQLKRENEMLEEKIKLLTKELGYLKDLFLAHAGSAHGINLENNDLEAILREEPKRVVVKEEARDTARIRSLQDGEQLHLGREDGKSDF